MSDKVTLTRSGIVCEHGKAARGEEASEKTKQEVYQVTNRSLKLLLSGGWKALVSWPHRDLGHKHLVISPSFLHKILTPLPGLELGSKQ